LEETEVKLRNNDPKRKQLPPFKNTRKRKKKKTKPKKWKKNRRKKRKLKKMKKNRRKQKWKNPPNQRKNRRSVDSIRVGSTRKGTTNTIISSTVVTIYELTYLRYTILIVDQYIDVTNGLCYVISCYSIPAMNGVHGVLKWIILGPVIGS
jgi:hypothetical protein